MLLLSDNGTNGSLMSSLGNASRLGALSKVDTQCSSLSMKFRGRLRVYVNVVAASSTCMKQHRSAYGDFSLSSW